MLEKLKARWKTVLTTRWIFRPLVECLVAQPVLFLANVVVIGMSAGLLGQDLGLQSLFWSPDGVTQWLAGAFAAMFVGETLFIAFLVEVASPGGEWAEKNKELGADLKWWMFYSGSCPLLWAALAATAIRSHENNKLIFISGVFCGAGFVVLLVEGWRRVLRILKKPLPEKTKKQIENAPDQGLRFLQFMFFVFSIVTYLLIGAIELFYRQPPPAIVLCALFTIITSIYGFILAHAPRRHFGITVMVLIVIFGVQRMVGNRPFRDLDYTKPAELAHPELWPPAQLIPQLEALEKWRAQFPEKPWLVVVTASGGGIRAAVWSTAVMEALNRRIDHFSNYVRIATGASGGMVGLGYFFAADKDAPASVKNIGLDDLTTITSNLVIPFNEDRGTALERAWENNTTVLKKCFRDLGAGEKNGTRTSLVYTPMMVEDGRRLIISNLDFSFAASSSGWTIDNANEVYSRSSVEFFRLFPGEDLRLSTAARMSAAFPWITPATYIPTIPARRVVDAGYYDNYGVNLAARWIFHHRAWIRANTQGVILVQIRDALSIGDRTSLEAPDESALDRWLGWLISPIEGFLAARESSMSFRNDELVEIISREFNEPEPPEASFATAIFELGENAPLSWALTPSQRDAIVCDIAEPGTEGCSGDPRDSRKKNLDTLHGLARLFSAGAN